MKIFIGADHRGYQFKKIIVEKLHDRGDEVVDLGTHQENEACDYPKIAYAVATHVVRARGARGILVCMTGLGQAIAANKIPGAYAALCYTPETAALSRQHNNANILVLGAKFINPKELPEIVDVWLKSKFEGGRHLRRTKQIKEIEREFSRV